MWRLWKCWRQDFSFLKSRAWGEMAHLQELSTLPEDGVVWGGVESHHSLQHAVRPGRVLAWQCDGRDSESQATLSLQR